MGELPIAQLSEASTCFVPDNLKQVNGLFVVALYGGFPAASRPLLMTKHLIIVWIF